LALTVPPFPVSAIVVRWTTGGAPATMLHRGRLAIESERQRMCGDLEDDTRLDDELFARFLALAKRYGATLPKSRRPQRAEPAGEEARHAYMSRLFSELLIRAVGDAAVSPEGRRADAIGDQAIVLARLAGFLAGQLPPETDLFRAMVEAMTDGYGEPARRLDEAHDHHHHHHRHHH
jgi:hypothetical protein